MKKLILPILILFLFIYQSFADTHYMATDGADSGDCTGSSCLTLQYVMGQASSGDTIYIYDGTYTGALNQIDDSHMPPAGISTSQFTTLQAETVGGVVFDGEETREMFAVDNGTTGGNSSIKYWKFDGIQWVRSSGYGVNLQNGNEVPPDGDDDYKSYVYFRNCGSHSEHENLFRISYISFVLIERCWGWGGGRYGVNLFGAEDFVGRRIVIRQDSVSDSSSTKPSATFMQYGAVRVSWQNCVAIDIDNSLWVRVTPGESWRDPIGGFYLRYAAGAPQQVEDSEFLGCMSVNYDGSYPSSNGGLGLTGWYIQEDPINTTLENCLVLDSSVGFYARNLGSGYNVTGTNLTAVKIATSAGKATDSSWQGGIVHGNPGAGNFIITNSIAYDITHDTELSPGIAGDTNGSDYNDVNGTEDNTPDFGSNNITDNPGLLYPVRIETVSPCYGTGSGGANRGATIIYEYGTDGTFYGESGYNTITSNKLWPWPNEGLIKTWFSKDYGTTDETRGFCANGEDLTHYILEYLGTTVTDIDCDIYDECGTSQSTINTGGPISGGYCCQP